MGEVRTLVEKVTEILHNGHHGFIRIEEAARKAYEDALGDIDTHNPHPQDSGGSAVAYRGTHDRVQTLPDGQIVLQR